MRISGSTRAILRKPITAKQWRKIDAAPPAHRLGALWRTLKFNHPWPRHRDYDRPLTTNIR